MGGPSIRGPKNEHAALTFHALVGARMECLTPLSTRDLTGPNLGLFNNGLALATALGGSLDLNRSREIVAAYFAGLSSYPFGGVSQNEFAISVGVLYRLRKQVAPGPVNK